MFRRNEFTTAMTLVAHSVPTKHNTLFQETFSGDFRKIGDPRLWLHVLSFAFGYSNELRQEFNLSKMAYLGDIDNWEKFVGSLEVNNIERVVGCNAFIPLFLQSEEHEKRAIECVKNSKAKYMKPQSRYTVLFYMSLFCRECHLALIFDGDSSTILKYILQFLHIRSMQIVEYYENLLSVVRFMKVAKLLYERCLGNIPYNRRFEYICQGIQYDNDNKYDEDFINSPEFDKEITISDEKESINVGVFQSIYALFHLRRKKIKDEGFMLCDAELKIQNLLIKYEARSINDIRNSIDFQIEMEKTLFEQIAKYEESIQLLETFHSFYYTFTRNVTKIPSSKIKKLFHMKKDVVYEGYDLRKENAQQLDHA